MELTNEQKVVQQKLEKEFAEKIKRVDGKISLSMQKKILHETLEVRKERRTFRRKDMIGIADYTLEIPKVWDSLLKKTSKEEVFRLAVASYLTESDDGQASALMEKGIGLSAGDRSLFKNAKEKGIDVASIIAKALAEAEAKGKSPADAEAKGKPAEAEAKPKPSTK